MTWFRFINTELTNYRASIYTILKPGSTECYAVQSCEILLTTLPKQSKSKFAQCGFLPPPLSHLLRVISNHMCAVMESVNTILIYIIFSNIFNLEQSYVNFHTYVSNNSEVRFSNTV